VTNYIKVNINNYNLDIFYFERDTVKLKKSINRRNIEIMDTIKNLLKTDLDEIKNNLNKCIIDGVFSIQAFYKVFSHLKRVTK